MTRSILDRIASQNPKLNAYNSVLNDRALQIAKECDLGKHGTLAGMPIAVKDNLCTSFGRTTCSSKMLENFNAPYDATVIQKLEAAGAVIVESESG